jgi:type IX secretion system PorP/SprF family membrane protein
MRCKKIVASHKSQVASYELRVTSYELRVTSSELLAYKINFITSMRYVLSAMCYLLFTTHCSAQDLHFSQYYRTPIFLNPALCGSMEEDIRLMAIARNQWATLPVSYNSIGMSGDMNFPVKVSKDKFGAGLQLLADRAGDARFTTLQATGSGAYHLVTSGLNFMDLSLGVNANFIQRSYDPYRLTYDNQFNGDYFDPTIPISEQFDRLNLSFFDFGLGLNYQQIIDGQHVLIVGSSMQHILSKEQKFLDKSSNTLLQPRFNMYLNGEYKFSTKYSVFPLFYYQGQDKKSETVLGIGFGMNLAPRSFERNKIKLGLNFRLGDAFCPWVQYEHQKTSVQLSYDLNTSPLKIASNSYGGLELSVGYVIRVREQRERLYDFCPYIWF